MLAVAVVLMVAAGCSSDDSGEDDAASDTTAAAEETTTSVADTTTTTAAVTAPGEAECGETVPDCTGSVTPAEGLADGDEIAIEATGFEPNLDLGITQCASEGDPDNNMETTGAEHCNLRAVGSVTSDADGAVSTTYVVAAGQTMTTNTEAGVTCDAEHDCVVSVGELVPDPDAQRVTFQLKFA
ncbi:MAG TPA: neocarzinostatin apoprotein domain-containing protein [Acidimicrobiales bacterium]